MAAIRAVSERMSVWWSFGEVVTDGFTRDAAMLQGVGI
jgi:hypothetical protein